LLLKCCRFVFEQNESALKPAEYNLYVKPKMTQPDFDVTKLICFVFLKREISKSDELVYRWLIHYIVKTVNISKSL